MSTAKDLVIRQIEARTANDFIRENHYSGRVAPNSQIHLGAFWGGRLEGVLQFGPSLDKRKIQGLVRGTLWHEFIELNRLAFTEALPRNSESRALAVSMRLLRKHAPQLKWVISFADGTQCGDGTIYRASGFLLTAIKKNDQIWQAPEAGARESRTSLTDNTSKHEQAKAETLRRGYATKGSAIMHSASMRPGIGAIGSAAVTGGASSMRKYIDAGFKPLEGFQLRYIYFLDPSYRERLTVPVLPFSEIEARGARMYRGERLCAASKAGVATGDQPVEGGSTPTAALQEITRDDGAG